MMIACNEVAVKVDRKLLALLVDRGERECGLKRFIRYNYQDIVTFYICG